MHRCQDGSEHMDCRETRFEENKRSHYFQVVTMWELLSIHTNKKKIFIVCENPSLAILFKSNFMFINAIWWPTVECQNNMTFPFGGGPKFHLFPFWYFLVRARKITKWWPRNNLLCKLFRDFINCKSRCFPIFVQNIHVPFVGVL